VLHEPRDIARGRSARASSWAGSTSPAGASFRRTRGFTSMGGTDVHAIHRRFGQLPLKSYPVTSFTEYLRTTRVRKQVLLHRTLQLSQLQRDEAKLDLLRYSAGKTQARSAASHASLSSSGRFGFRESSGQQAPFRSSKSLARRAVRKPCSSERPQSSNLTRSSPKSSARRPQNWRPWAMLGRKPPEYDS